MEPESFRICEGLFTRTKHSNDFEMSIRIRLLLQWAVTIQREGTHRAIIVAKVGISRLNTTEIANSSSKFHL